MAPAAARFALPNVAAMLMVATLLYCVFIFGSQQLFRDADTGWHIRNGEWIIAHRSLPSTDPYSFSKPGAPWFAWEWGADAAMGLADRWGGLPAVAGLFAFAIAATSWLWARLSFIMDGDFFLTGSFAPLMVTAASAHWLARPHVFGWLLALAWVGLLEARPKAAVPVALFAGCLWANIHASFFLAPGIALLYAVSHFIRPLIWPLDVCAERALARRYAALAVAAAAGTLANPYGWRLHQHVFEFLTDTRLTSQIAEFQSFNFHLQGATQIALVMALVALGAVLALAQKNIARFLLAALLCWGGLRSARMIPLVALLGLPIANAGIAAALRQMRGLRQPLVERLDAALAYSARLRRMDRQFSGVLFILIALALAPLGLRADAAFPAGTFPVAAAQSLELLPADARILSSDHFGGYLIYRFKGSRKVFFDGRSDFYGAAFLEDYGILAAARAGWRAIAARYRFTHALLPPNSPLVGALEDDGWKALYEDRTGVLLEAR